MRRDEGLRLRGDADCGAGLLFAVKTVGEVTAAVRVGQQESAADALERIEIAQDIRDRIAERLWIGASLIISDQPLSGETGPVGTDLTVKLR